MASRDARAMVVTQREADGWPVAASIVDWAGYAEFLLAMGYDVEVSGQ